MSVQDVLQAVWEGDNYVITVVDHKTVKGAPASIPVLLYEEIRTFAMLLPSRLSNPDLRQVPAVSSFAGSYLSSSAYNNTLRVRYKQPIGRNPSSRAIRKTIVSRVLTERHEVSVDLAMQMSHSTKTQLQYYKMILVRKRAVEMSRVITSTAFPDKKAAATDPSGALAAVRQPQATTQSLRKRHPIISSDEESEEEVIAPPVSPTWSLPTAEEIGNLTPLARS
ncbi:hypothetical protein SNE40_017542 [Patella caerulea]|uniref:Uncharacterized protein n=1 Tax=Patella caerulea TaxID=87958 RepID=A0AAN8PG06_PATCE